MVSMFKNIVVFHHGIRWYIFIRVSYKCEPVHEDVVIWALSQPVDFVYIFHAKTANHQRLNSQKLQSMPILIFYSYMSEFLETTGPGM